MPIAGKDTKRLQTALLKETKRRCNRYIDTVYAGGGTPTLLPPEFWQRFFEVLRNTVFTGYLTETTIETNPGILQFNELSEYKKAGFNRLSIGVQSFSDRDLEVLGRIHDSIQSVDTYSDARKAGFENISIDLIYGIPGQTLEDWEYSLLKAIELSPEHISCYELSIEKGTPLALEIYSGNLNKPDEETCVQMYLLTDRLLKENGYLHYEVSSFARGEKFISKHNSKYWSRAPYIGLGPSAHSFDGYIERRVNVSDIEEYYRDVEDGLWGSWTEEVLFKADVNLEKVMLGLRCIQGFDPDDVDIDREYLEKMISDGKVTVEDGRVIPTVRGMLFADGDAVILTPNPAPEFPFD